MKIRSTEIARGFLKSPCYDRLRMPQFYRWKIATGELALWSRMVSGKNIPISARSGLDAKPDGFTSS